MKEAQRPLNEAIREAQPVVKIKVEKSQTLILSEEAQRPLNEVIQEAQPVVEIKVEKSQTLILSERSPETFKRSNPGGSTVSKN